MKEERKKLLAKLAYLYYIEEKSQAEIADLTGIYRTTVSRMLAEAKKEGIVMIDIASFDSQLFHLENTVKERYGLKGLELVATNPEDSQAMMEQRVAQAAASMLKSLLTDGMKVGFSWGRSLSLLVEALGARRLKDIHFYPLAGGPSHIHARYHVNTLIYDMACKLHGECSFINATIIQEDKALTQGILSAKYFEGVQQSWKELDLAIVGIGGQVYEQHPQWLDMLTATDFEHLRQLGAVGEICCRFFDQNGHSVYPELQERTIAISLSALKELPATFAVAYGEYKAAAILSVLRAGYIDYLVTDEATIQKVLELDQD